MFLVIRDVRLLLINKSRAYSVFFVSTILFQHGKSIRGRSRRVAKFLQERILIAFDFIWKVSQLSDDRNFATLLDPRMTKALNFKSELKKESIY